MFRQEAPGHVERVNLGARCVIADMVCVEEILTVVAIRVEARFHQRVGEEVGVPLRRLAELGDHRREDAIAVILDRFPPAQRHIRARLDDVAPELAHRDRERQPGAQRRFFEQQRDMFTLKARSTFGTANEKGVGLGLILCKEFTEQQGGRIDFDSTPGKGSTFYIFMPLG